jgi:phosphatidylinositol phospholipase C gamma-1
MERLGISSETPAPSRNRSETGSSSGLKNSTPSNPQMKDVDEEKPDVVVVRTLARYAAARPDELSFGKNEIIKRVEKYDGGWWKHTTPQGEAKWLPANFVEELEFSARKTDDDVEDDNPLGALLKGHFSIEGAELSPITMMEEYHCFTITPDTLNMTFTVGSMVEKDVKDWHEVIMGSLQEKTLTADGLDTEALKAKKKEKKGKKGIAKELSDIVVYTRSVPFESFEHSIKNYECYEMSSFPESKAEKLCRRQPSEFTKYTRRQFARVYPNGKRVDSSNFEPELMWNCGLQMVALNYQTPDRPMQVNNGLFRQNGACGYLLKPKFLTDGSGFNPFDPTTFGSIMRKQITIEICCAKHLHKSGKGIPSPFVEVEMIGAYCDSGVKYKTKTKSVQGFNPVWMETFVFDVTMPALAMLRFAVMDEDMFGDPNFVGQSCVPIQQLQNGTRSVQLLNGYSEPIGMSYLLINVTTVEHEESDQDKAIRTLTQQSRQLSDEIEKLMAEQIGIADKNSAKSKELEKRIEEMQGQVSQNEKECTQLIKSSSDQMKLQQSKRRKGSKK